MLLWGRGGGSQALLLLLGPGCLRAGEKIAPNLQHLLQQLLLQQMQQQQQQQQMLPLHTPFLERVLEQSAAEHR